MKGEGLKKRKPREKTTEAMVDGHDNGDIHVLIFPFPSQGHMNPIIQFAKRLVSRGLKVTLLTTLYASKTIRVQPQGEAISIQIQVITDGSEDRKESDDDDSLLERYKNVASEGLAAFLRRTDESHPRPRFLVYDSFMPWVLDVAKKCGLDAAPFYTQSCALSSINFHVYNKALKLPLQTPSVELPSMPLLEAKDLPIYDYDPANFQAILNITSRQFSNFLEAEMMFCSSFDGLEEEVIKWMISCKWPVKTIGPAIPSKYLDGRVKDDSDYGLSLFEPHVNTCMSWLDAKQTGSVVYASLGSVVVVGEEQLEELALGLMNSNHPFLLVVRESEQKKLPENSLEGLSDKGLVVNWCPQLEVLTHRAVGCFVTHCGWNSTVEAICLGMPMVAMPQWADQTTNAKFIADVWKAGVRARANEKGVFSKEEIALCIGQVMEGEKQKEIKANSVKLKELAKQAVDEGGSSDKNIDEFVAKLRTI